MKRTAATPRRNDGEGHADPALLISMAAAEFAEHGFEGTSMRLLADKCLVTTTALYYHFGSKEELYVEVCQHKFDEITHIMGLQLSKAMSIEDRLEVFVRTLFDEWHRDKTLLLMTQRAVMNATIGPEHCIAESHYRQLMGLMHKLLSTYFKSELDEDFTFTFGSLLFGYCSLMSFDRKASTMNTAEYRRHRKEVLLKFCRRIWRSMATLA